MNTMEILRSARQFQTTAREQSKPAQQGGRVKIIAGSRKIGEQINGRAITGFGKTWAETVRDEDACVYGLEPGKSHRISVQYAYF